MIIKTYSPPIINTSITSQTGDKPAHRNSLSRHISFTENSSNDIKIKAKEISLKYDILVDDILHGTPCIKENQSTRLNTIGLAITALEHAAKTNSSSTLKKPILGLAITEKIKNICDALPVNKKESFKHDKAYLLRGNNFISEFLFSKGTAIDKISYAQLLSIGDKMRKNSADPAAIDQMAINKFAIVWDLRTKLAQD